MKKECLNCKIIYESHSNNNKYCSAKCGKAFRKVEKKMIVAVCPICKKNFSKSEGNNRKKYCSDACNSKAKQLKNRKYNLDGLFAICSYCNNKFKPNANQINAKNVFCSSNCRKKGWRRYTPELTCEYCLCKFTASGNKRKYCSKECHDKHLKATKSIEKRCKQCGSLFEVWVSRLDAKYCSEKCYRASYRTGKKPNTKCFHCSNDMYKAPSLQLKQKYWFCSRKCMGDYFRKFKLFSGENNARFIGFQFNRRKKYYGENWPSQRDLVRARDFYTCQICNITEEEYGQELSVHHIYPFILFNNDYERANHEKNLICLCEPCHRFVHSDLKPSIYHQLKIPEDWDLF
ncbi:HNH endonuclease [Lysinibacillus sp. LZ02]|uniref:HNH endonuclease n=1 Tax=Lysinibacillus sp. LZ02 TaxID=3420668 RepID=UPI003D35DE2A